MRKGGVITAAVENLMCMEPVARDPPSSTVSQNTDLQYCNIRVAQNSRDKKWPVYNIKQLNLQLHKCICVITFAQVIVKHNKNSYNSED